MGRRQSYRSKPQTSSTPMRYLRDCKFRLAKQRSNTCLCLICATILATVPGLVLFNLSKNRELISRFFGNLKYPENNLSEKQKAKLDRWALLRGDTETVWARVKPQKRSTIIETIYPGTANCTHGLKARLIVITMDRKSSLQRLLKSAARARYRNACVHMDIWIDRRSENEDLHRGVVRSARSFVCPHGMKRVYIRLLPGGLYQQWLWTWDLSKHTDEFAVILEDDLELAPVWFEWLVEARRRYGDDEGVAGFTLQRHLLRSVRNSTSSVLTIPSNTSVYKYQWLGSWGFAPKRHVWEEFRKWFKDMVQAGKKPYVPGLITTKWYMEQERPWLGYTPNMWTQWFVKFSEDRGYFSVVPHLPGGTTICANHKERGLHFKLHRPKKDAPLYEGNSDGFSWPTSLLKFGWNGTVLNNGS